MLVKYEDRLTADGCLALRALESRSMGAFLRTVQAGNRRAGGLPFADQSAVRFFLNRESGRVLLSADEFQAEIRAQSARLSAVASEVRSDPSRFADFLKSRAHEEWAFARSPLFLIHVAGSEARIGIVTEGRTGRKYRRSQDEVVAFLSAHPDAGSIYSDIEMRFMFQHRVRSAQDLSLFIGDSVERLDFVLDLVELLAPSFFDPASESGSLSGRKDWLLELDSDARATLDFDFYPAGRHRLEVRPFAQAREDLRDALKAISEFAARSGIREYAGLFSSVLAELETGKGAGRSELFELNGIPDEARSLAAAALKADVFAGMGSWNDVEIEKTAEYRRLSNGLALSILESIACSCSYQG